MPCLNLKQNSKHQGQAISSTANEIWEAISAHGRTLAEQTGKAVVAVDAHHRVAASGVHWKPGVIVTASHLVRRAAEVNINLPDGNTVTGTVAGRDSTTDLAPSAPTAPQRLRLCRSLLARKSVSWSWLSGVPVGASFPPAPESLLVSEDHGTHGAADRSIASCAPMSAAIPGSPSSALVNSRGELLGINSSVLARESVITLPTETVDRVINELLEHGHVMQPYLGISMQEVQLPLEWRSSADPERRNVETADTS